MNRYEVSIQQHNCGSAERDHACEYPIYDLRVAKWPHMRPCGKPAEATVTNRSGKATLRCPDHLF